MTIIIEQYEEEDDDYRLMTDEEVTAVIEADDLIEDYADEIFVSSLELDPEKDPYGWDITDMVDWESLDYE